MDAHSSRGQYLLYELALTAALLAVPFLLFARYFGAAFLLLLPGWGAGLVFSWRGAGGKDTFARQLLASAGILGVGIWLMFAMSGAADYGQLALVCVEGIFICSVALSFFVSNERSLNLLQYLSLTAFIGHAFFYPSYDIRVLVLIAVYGALWLCLLRLKFYALAYTPPRLLFRADGSFFLALVLALAGWLAAALATSDASKRVTDSSQEKTWQEASANIASVERDYFGQVAEFQGKMTLRLPEFPLQSQRQDGVMSLSEVTSGSSSAFESQGAEEGLISLLNNPGPGLGPKQEDVGLTFSTRGFMDSKTKYRQEQSFKQAAQELKQQALPERLSSLDALNALRNADTAQEIARQEGRLREKAYSGRFSRDSQDAALQGIEGLAEWKTMELYRSRISSLSGAFDQLTGVSRGQFNAVLSSIRGANDLKRIARARQSLEGVAVAALELKLQLLEYSQRSNLEGGLAGQSGMEGYSRRRLVEQLNRAMTKGDPRAQAASLGVFLNSISDSAPSLAPAAKELVATESYLAREKANSDVGELIAKSALPDKGKKFMSELKKAGELPASRGIEIVDGLFRRAGKLRSDGFMRSREYGELLERLQELRAMIELRIQTSIDPETEPEPESLPEPKFESEKPQFAPAQLISVVVSPESMRFTAGQKFSLKAEAVYGDSSRKDITGKALWEVSDPALLSVSAGGNGQALRKGNVSIRASSLGVRSLPAEAVIVPLPLDPVAAAKKAAAWLALLAVLAFSALVIRQSLAARALLAGRQETNAFIQALYANLMMIILLLGLEKEGQSPPRIRAREAKASLGIGAEIDRFTVCYEESRYSGLQLEQPHAQAALELYDHIIADILKRLQAARKARLFLSCIINGVPVFLRWRWCIES